MDSTGFSNPNRNTGGRSMRDYEAGASEILYYLERAMDMYGGDVRQPLCMLESQSHNFPPPQTTINSRHKRQLGFSSSGLNRIYLGLTVLIVMMQISQMNRKFDSVQPIQIFAAFVVIHFQVTPIRAV